MRKSIEQLLEGLGSLKTDFETTNKLPRIEKVMIQSAANFIEDVKDNLIKLNKVSSGGLSTGIAQGELIQDSDGYSLSLGYKRGSKESKYYDFINKGVAGVKENRTKNSPYKFKKLTVGGKMVESIAEWYKKGGKRFSIKYSPITKGEKKGRKLGKMLSEAQSVKSLAYATAINIKKRGFKSTFFFDNAIKKNFGSDFSRLMAKAGAKDISVTIKKAFDDNNPNKSK